MQTELIDTTHAADTNFSASPPAAREMSAPDMRLKHLRVSLASLAGLLGLIAAWADRHAINLDGISYLDMGDAFLRGDWGIAINAHWSPLYGLLLGLGTPLFGFASYADFAAAHFVNFIIYLGAIACFDFLLRELIVWNDERKGNAADERGGLPARAWVVLGYAVFILVSIEFISLRLLTPDMLVASILYVVSALTLRLKRQAANRKTFMLLGVVLALGYYAKAAMFPLAFVFLCVNLFGGQGFKRNAPGVVLAAAVFLLLASPLVATLSIEKGRFTFSDSGRLVRAWFINGISTTHGQVVDERYGAPVHPLPVLHDAPPVYKYDLAVGGTYPVWYDPSYWYEGITPRFEFMRQVRAVVRNLAKYHNMFFSYLQSSLLVGLLILLFYTNWGVSKLARDIVAPWALIVPAAAGFAMYALVYTEARYTGGFFVLLWVGLFAAVRLPPNPAARRLALATTIIIAALLLFMTAVEIAPKVYTATRELARGTPLVTHPRGQAVEGLRQLGVAHGDSVAVLYAGTSLGAVPRMVALVRLADARIVAETPPKDSTAFWAADDAKKAEIIRAFASSTAEVVIVENPPDGAVQGGWQRLGDTEFYAYKLTQ